MRCFILLLALGTTLAQDTYIPDEERPLVRCPRDPCNIKCPENGYQTDDRGCPLCRCQQNPCSDAPYDDTICPAGEVCTASKCHSHPCTSMKVTCVPAPLEVEPVGPEEGNQNDTRCPMPMCANFCPAGLKRNKFGCLTCECNQPSCETHQCEEGSVCKTRPDLEMCKGSDCPVIPSCTAKPLCHDMRDSSPEMSFNPVCDPDGQFRTHQCHGTDCWCVNDIGEEIEQTRVTQQVPSCARVRSVQMEVDMVLVHEIDHVELQYEQLKGTMKTHLSRWLLVEEKWITVVRIHQDEVQMLQIHAIVVHDGESDLPSTGNFLQHQVQKDKCHVNYNGNTLKPIKNKLKIHHKFEERPAKLPEQPIWEAEPVTCWEKVHHYYSHHRLTVVVGGVGLIIMLLSLIGVTVAIIKRRKMAAYQFRHRRLENMDNFKKNLVLSTELDVPVDPVTGEKKQKPEDLGGPVVDASKMENVSLA